MKDHKRKVYAIRLSRDKSEYEIYVLSTGNFAGFTAKTKFEAEAIVKSLNEAERSHQSSLKISRMKRTQRAKKVRGNPRKHVDHEDLIELDRKMKIYPRMSRGDLIRELASKFGVAPGTVRHRLIELNDGCRS